MTDKRLNVIRRWVGDSRRWIKAFLKDVQASSSILTVIAMGSAVRERGHRRSDLDLLVLFRGKRPSLRPPIEVDVRMHPLETAEEQLAAGHEVLGWAMKFGETLYDPDKAWETLENKFRDQVPLPSASEASKRARESLMRAREMLKIGDDSAADDLILAGLTQLVRGRLIKSRIYPASRPELPGQLRVISPGDPLAQMLEDAMYGDFTPLHLLRQLDTVS